MFDRLLQALAPSPGPRQWPYTCLPLLREGGAEGKARMGQGHPSSPPGRGSQCAAGLSGSLGDKGSSHLVLFQEEPLLQDPTALAWSLWNRMVSWVGLGTWGAAREEGRVTTTTTAPAVPLL